MVISALMVKSTSDMMVLKSQTVSVEFSNVWFSFCVRQFSYAMVALKPCREKTCFVRMKAGGFSSIHWNNDIKITLIFT